MVDDIKSLDLDGRSKTVVFNKVVLEFNPNTTSKGTEFYIVKGSLELIGEKFGGDRIILSEGDYIDLTPTDIKIETTSK